ncbi:hypothetical protein [Corynebacterium renale]|uniref:hypothetical protein n=1 Tax=Corynebacterium renale TaxID=1724 RepID=UPI000DFFF4C4|nr:hypothetical protein [Corynebacterium renale]STD70316.1 Uncharacterised protein [Corynebacterium renale]
MGGKTLDKVLAETVDQFLGDDKLNDIILNIMREALGNRPVDDVVAGMILKSMGGNTLDKVAQDIIDKSLDKLTGGKTLGKIGGGPHRLHLQQAFCADAECVRRPLRCLGPDCRDFCT